MNLSTINRWTLWLCGAALLTPFVVAGLYVTPQADDLLRGEISVHAGVFAEMRYHYGVTDGRFMATALMATAGLNLDRSVAVMPYVLMVAWWLACWRCLDAVGSALWPNSPASIWVRLTYTAGLAFLLLGVYLTRMPSPCQGFYWLCGGLVYMVPGILSLLLTAELVRLHDPQTTGRWRLTLHSITAALLIAAAVGCSEIVMFLWDLTLGLLLLMALVKRKRAAWLAPVLLAAAVASAVLVFSPSNARRAQQYEKSNQIVRSVARSALHTAIKTTVWGIDPLIWLGALAAVPMLRRLPPPPRLAWMRHPLAWWWIVGATLLAMTLGALPAYIGMGHAPPLRAGNLLYLVFTVGMFAALYARIAANPDWAPIRVRPWLVFAALFAFGSWPTAVWNSVRSGPMYWREYASRMETVQQAVACGERRIDVAPFSSRPKLVFFADIEADPKFWINIAFSRRYRLDEVSARESSRALVR